MTSNQIVTVPPVPVAFGRLTSDAGVGLPMMFSPGDHPRLHVVPLADRPILPRRKREKKEKIPAWLNTMPPLVEGATA